MAARTAATGRSTKGGHAAVSSAGAVCRFFSYPTRTALAIAVFMMSGAALFRGGSILVSDAPLPSGGPDRARGVGMKEGTLLRINVARQARGGANGPAYRRGGL